MKDYTCFVGRGKIIPGNSRKFPEISRRGCLLTSPKPVSCFQKKVTLRQGGGKLRSEEPKKKLRTIAEKLRNNYRKLRFLVRKLRSGQKNFGFPDSGQGKGRQKITSPNTVKTQQEKIFHIFGVILTIF